MAEINEKLAVERFQAMLRKRTVSDRDGNFDREVFASYLPMLKEMYPTVFEVVESQLINEFGIVLKWKGKDSALNPVVLMSHYDVVGDEGQDWKHPAFEAEIHDGVIWARGSIDTKGLLAATLEAMEKLIAEGYTPPRDIYYCSSNCEEVAGDTMKIIVEWFEENNIKPWFVLDEGGAIMEDLPMGIKTPFAMVAVSEKGWATVKLKATATGAAPAAKATKANSKLSAPQKIVKALAALEKSPTRSTVTGQLEGMLKSFSPYVDEPLKSVFKNINLVKPVLKKVLETNADTAAMIRTMITLVDIDAKSENGKKIATEATATLRLRIAPQDSLEYIVGHIQKVVGEDIEVTTEDVSLPPRISDHNTESFRYIESTIKKVYPHVGVAPFVLNAFTDSRFFARICPEVYRFGAFSLDNERFDSVHNANERMPVKDYLKAIDFYAEFLKNLK